MAATEFEQLRSSEHEDLKKLLAGFRGEVLWKKVSGKHYVKYQAYEDLPLVSQGRTIEAALKRMRQILATVEYKPIRSPDDQDTDSGPSKSTSNYGD